MWGRSRRTVSLPSHYKLVGTLQSIWMEGLFACEWSGISSSWHNSWWMHKSVRPGQERLGENERHKVSWTVRCAGPTLALWSGCPSKTLPKKLTFDLEKVALPYVNVQLCMTECLKAPWKVFSMFLFCSWVNNDVVDANITSADVPLKCAVHHLLKQGPKFFHPKGSSLLYSQTSKGVTNAVKHLHPSSLVFWYCFVKSIWRLSQKWPCSCLVLTVLPLLHSCHAWWYFQMLCPSESESTVLLGQGDIPLWLRQLFHWHRGFSCTLLLPFPIHTMHDRRHDWQFGKAEVCEFQQLSFPIEVVRQAAGSLSAKYCTVPMINRICLKRRYKACLPNFPGIVSMLKNSELIPLYRVFRQK